ncbi:MAG: hypothetical protein COA58_09255 [Bacteroidetes bacterium]|nr:MAG: hypothetical protein COA58_09255 [Bacteroidota bacterium]
MMNYTTNLRLRIIPLFLFFTVGLPLFVAAQSTSWRGTSNKNWTTSGNWTNGVPSSTVHAVIGDASFTGANQPKLNSGTLKCKSLTIGNGTKASTLTISKKLIVYGDVIIGSNGTILHNSSKLITVQGNWTNNGSYTATKNSSRIALAGQNVTLTGATTFKDLTIYASTTLTLASDITVNSDLDCYGVLNPTANYAVYGSADLDVERDGVIEVHTDTFAKNYPIGNIDINDRGEVNYASASVTQLVSSDHKYGILRISGGSDKFLSSDLPDIHNGSSTRGRVYIDAGIFDLNAYECDRESNGGVFVIAANAELHIGGTEDFPNRFTTVTLATSSTVQYDGNNQSVKNLSYGNLLLSGASGSVTKTLSSGTMNISGDFILEIGDATSLVANAGGSLNVNQNVSIEEDCSLNASSYSHVFKSDLDNEGTFSGSTSTVKFTGSNTQITGDGTFDFYNVSFAASGITGVSGTIFTVGGDAKTLNGGSFTHQSGGVFEMTGTTKTISGDDFYFYDLEASGTVTNSGYIDVAGDIIVDGSFTASNDAVTVSGASSDIDGTGTITFDKLTITGNVTTARDLTINDDFSIAITASFTASGGDVTFDGASDLSGTASLFDVSINSSKTLELAANSQLNIGNTFANSGTFTTTNSVPNKVVYNKIGDQIITAETYYNLDLTSGGTKTFSGSLAVNNDITISSGVTLDASSHTLSLYRHWNNNGTFTSSTSDVQLRGDNSAVVSGVTTFNTFTVNKGSSDVQVQLSNNITATNIAMTQGFVDTEDNSITTTSTRTGDGIIIGTIIHNHAIANGTTYYFEGPNNGLTFNSPSSMNSVSVTVKLGEVINVDPYVESVTREYIIDVPSGTYTSVDMRLHYEDHELNAFVEPGLAIYKYNSGTIWDSLGYTTRNLSANYVELIGITNTIGNFMMSGARNIVRWNGSISSAWDNAANWTTVSGASMSSRVPDSTDVARIGDTLFVNQPTISTVERVNVLRFADTKAATVTLNGGNLTIDGSVRGNWSTNQSHTLDVGDDTLTIGTTLTFSDGISSHDIELIVDGGLANINYDIVLAGTGKLTFTGSGNLNLGHDFDYCLGTFTPGIGTITYTGSVAQNIAPVTYYNLSINKPSARATVESPIEVLNNLITLTGGELVLLDSADINGDVTIGASTEVIEFNSQVQVAGDWLNNGIFQTSGGTVTFDGASNQTVDGNTFNNLKINKSAGILSLTGNLNIESSVEIVSGTFDLDVYTASRTSEGGNLIIDSNATILIGGTSNFPSNFLTVSLDTHSTVNYDGSVVQEILPITYGNLVLSNGNPNAKTLNRGITIIGDLSINGSTLFSPDTSTINLYGNFSNSGTIDPGSSTLSLKGISKTLTGTSTLNNLSVIGGSYTVSSGAITMEGNMYIGSNGTLDLGSNTTTLDGDLTNNGSLISNGTSTFTGTRVQNISLHSAITSSSTGVINFNGTFEPIITSTSSPTFATVNINNTAGITPSVPWTVYTAMNIASGAKFDGGALTHTFYGNFNNNGEVYSSGKLLFTPGAPFSSGGTLSFVGDTFSSTGEVELAGTAPITLSGLTPNFGKLVISNTHSSGVTATNSSAWNVTGDLQILSGATLYAGSSTTYYIEGNLVNNGSLEGQTSNFIFTGDTVSIDGVGTNNFEDLEIENGTLLKMNNDIKIYSDLVVDGTLDTSGSTLEFAGSEAGTISGSAGSLFVQQLTSGKTSGAQTTLLIPVTVVGNLEMTGGQFVTDNTNLLIIADNATSSAGNDTSYVVGPMKKVGDDAFVFPLGDSVKWARLGISAPSVSTDEFIAQFYSDPYTDTLTMATSPSPVLNNVSKVEYWTCDRNAGSSNVTVELYWENRSASGIDSANSDLAVARWNGSAWENAGSLAVQGYVIGSVTSSLVSSFSPFTFGSLGGAYNYLPVDLVEFDVVLNKSGLVDLTWNTASELNNDYFELEHSTNGEDFQPFTTVKGNGTTNEIQLYKAVHFNPQLGLNYYRLKQVDYDGNFKYHEKRVVQLNTPTKVDLYPNPAISQVNVRANNVIDQIRILNSVGQEIENFEPDAKSVVIDVSDFKSGIYFVQVFTEGQMKLLRVLKN